jgi:protein TonB
MTRLSTQRWAWLAGLAVLAAGAALANPVDKGPGPLVPKGPAAAPAEPDLPADGSKARVVLRCIVMVDARVDKCVVERESPPGHGLGEAALRMTSQIKISPENFSRDIVGEQVDIPLSFSREEEVADMPGGPTPM